MMPTITSQIETVEKNLEKCHSRLTVLSERLSSDEYTLAQRKKLREEMKYLGAEVDQYDKELKHLRKENRRTMFTSVAVLTLCFIAYVLYSTYHAS